MTRDIEVLIGKAICGELDEAEKAKLVSALESDPEMARAYEADSRLGALLSLAAQGSDAKGQFERSLAARLRASTDQDAFVPAVRQRALAKAPAGRSTSTRTRLASVRKRRSVAAAIAATLAAAAAVVLAATILAPQRAPVTRDGTEPVAAASGRPAAPTPTSGESVAGTVAVEAPDVRREETSAGDLDEVAGGAPKATAAPVREARVAEVPSDRGSPERRAETLVSEGAVDSGARLTDRHLAYLDAARGAVEYARGLSGQWTTATPGVGLAAGHRFRTKLSRARIAFESGTVLHVNRFTTFTLGLRGRTPGLSMAGGEVFIETEETDTGFWVETRRGIAVDLGTRFGVRDSLNLTTVVVVEGKVEASTDAGKATLGDSQEVLLVRRVSPPGPVRKVRDLEARLGWILRKQQAPHAGLKVLLVVGAEPGRLNDVDQLVIDHLKAREAEVTVARQDHVPPAAVAAADVVAVSVTITSVVGARQFRHAAVPLVIWEGLYDLGMRTDRTATVVPSESRVLVTAPGHPLAAGLRGVVEVTSRPAVLMGAAPGGDAVVVAVAASDRTTPLVVGYEKGARMPGGPAPARRVHFFANRAVPELNENGWALFDAAIRWAASVRDRP